VVGLVAQEGLAAHGDRHVGRHPLGHDIFQPLAAPAGEDLLAQFGDLLGGDVAAILRPLRHNVELAVDPGDGALRGAHAHARQQRTVADNDFIRVNVDAHGAHQVQQHPGAADRHGLSLRALLAGRGVAGALDVDLAYILDQALLEAGCAGGVGCVVDHSTHG